MTGVPSPSATQTPTQGHAVVSTSTRPVVVVSAWLCQPRVRVHPTLILLSLSFLLPFEPHAISPMASQSQEATQAASQQSSTSKPPSPSKRSFFTRSSSRRGSKNKEIQSTSPPEINSDGQSPPSQSDNPPSAPAVPTP